MLRIFPAADSRSRVRLQTVRARQVRKSSKSEVKYWRRTNIRSSQVLMKGENNCSFALIFRKGRNVYSCEPSRKVVIVVEVMDSYHCHQTPAGETGGTTTEETDEEGERE